MTDIPVLIVGGLPPEASGLIVRWGFLIHSLSQYGYTPADFNDERCIAMIRQAVGVTDLPVKILGLSAWEASAFVAEQYRHGRIFLAGDAAHEMPPMGFGWRHTQSSPMARSWCAPTDTLPGARAACRATRPPFYRRRSPT